MDIAAALESARGRGVAAVRTSAMFPRAADVSMQAGFTPIDRLVLLRLSLDHRTTANLRARRAEVRQRISPMRPWHYQRCAHVDQEAFGPMWGNDTTGLADVRKATPTHRSRVAKLGNRIAGFAISGSGGGSGYLQRLAVAPLTRRQGVATALVLDAVTWLGDRGLDAVLVNTGTTNRAALSLYDGLGFVALSDQLTIAEYRFEPDVGHPT